MVVQGDVLLVCYVADVASKLQTHSLATGSKQRDIPLPGIGSITSFGGRREDSKFFFSFSSFTEPGATYRSARGRPMIAPPTVCNKFTAGHGGGGGLEGGAGGGGCQSHLSTQLG